MNKDLVSVIISTKNEENNIEACLKSIKKQTYKNTEVIVVDNNSLDKTKEIAKGYTHLVFNKGPERSTQRNYGAKKSRGKYLLFVDADMVLGDDVVGACVSLIHTLSKGGLIIPEKSVGEGFWAKCLSLEKGFYEGVEWLEAARFYTRKAFEDVGGFDTHLISGEDWDLSQRVFDRFGIGRVNKYILHIEGNIALAKILSKKYYYAKEIGKYFNKKNNSKQISQQVSILQRYSLFFSSPKKLLKDPLVGLGLIILKGLEFTFGGVGYIVSKIK